jgi:hypothetical protein
VNLMSHTINGIFLQSELLGLWTSSIVRKPSISECHTPLSEPFRFQVSSV